MLPALRKRAREEPVVVTLVGTLPASPPTVPMEQWGGWLAG